MGDYLIVGLSTDEFNFHEKGKKSFFTYDERKQLLEAIRYVDLVIPEKNWQQKEEDVDKFKIDCFVIGDDWEGKFDYLSDQKHVEVKYIKRTPEISSSQIKSEIKREN